ncbi:MAG: peptidylprolyl isomerase [Bradymonadaceae bacterium]
MKEAMVRVMLQDVLRERVPLRDVDDEAVEAFYKENLADFTQVERRRALVLLVDTEEGAVKLKRDFETVKIGEDVRINAFRQLANRWSTDRASADNGGDIGHFEAGVEEEDAYRAKTASVLFELSDVGLISEPHETERGWQLVMMMERRPEQVRELDDVARDIRTRLFENRRQTARTAYIEELMKDAEIELFPELLGDIQLPEPVVPRRLEELHLMPVRDLKGAGVADKP